MGAGGSRVCGFADSDTPDASLDASLGSDKAAHGLGNDLGSGAGSGAGAGVGVSGVERPQQLEPYYARIFSEYDKDGDGCIDAMEFMYYYRDMLIAAGRSKAEADYQASSRYQGIPKAIAMFSAYDHEDSGKVSFEQVWSNPYTVSALLPSSPQQLAKAAEFFSRWRFMEIDRDAQPGPPGAGAGAQDGEGEDVAGVGRKARGKKAKKKKRRGRKKRPHKKYPKTPRFGAQSLDEFADQFDLESTGRVREGLPEDIANRVHLPPSGYEQPEQREQQQRQRQPQAEDSDDESDSDESEESEPQPRARVSRSKSRRRVNSSGARVSPTNRKRSGGDKMQHQLDMISSIPVGGYGARRTGLKRSGSSSRRMLKEKKELPKVPVVKGDAKANVDPASRPPPRLPPAVARRSSQAALLSAHSGSVYHLGSTDAEVLPTDPEELQRYLHEHQQGEDAVTAKNAGTVALKSEDLDADW